MVYHFDLYRLPRREEFFAAGFDEYFNAGGICCLEWAEKIKPDLPLGAYLVSIAYFGAEGRQIEISRGSQ
jgi:tRNA threonylcarbamoyladenosine biosynthesis protein TsaE